MKAELINYTPDALELLIFAKYTRLRMSATRWREILSMSMEEKYKELDYVFGTIGSQLEFVDYVILISDDSRAFTQQLTRHRHASFAQQTQRAVDHSDFEYVTPKSCESSFAYHRVMEIIKQYYHEMIIGENIPIQDARGILPMNAVSNILMKMNLRAISEMMNVRFCYKAQGEFQDAAKMIRREILSVHPWTSRVLRANCVQYGYCCFPNEKDCPVKKAGLIKDWTEEQAQQLEKFMNDTEDMEKKFYAK